jgi:hypothetical protein
MFNIIIQKEYRRNFMKKINLYALIFVVLLSKEFNINCSLLNINNNLPTLNLPTLNTNSNLSKSKKKTLQAFLTGKTILNDGNPWTRNNFAQNKRINQPTEKPHN